MPAYEVEHICQLSPEQKDDLAMAITKIHSNHFNTPKLFVNVRFTNVDDHATYVAGKRRKANRMFAYVRAGPSRTQKDFDTVSEALMKAWDSIVPREELRMIMYFGAIIAGWEAGYSIPPAGEDAAWVKENMQSFRQKAEAGDEDFAELVEDVSSRGMA